MNQPADEDELDSIDAAIYLQVTVLVLRKLVRGQKLQGRPVRQGMTTRLFFKKAELDRYRREITDATH